MKDLITICTPSYNRGYLLGSLYESLEKQIAKNFQWIIVDDGSNDDTNDIVSEFIKNASFKIEYYKKENGGKHTALNLGIGKTNTELFFIVDSDDILINNATERIEYYWNSIENKEGFVGVAGLRCFKNGESIGTYNNTEYIDATSIEYRYKYCYKGDRAEVFRTDIMKKHLFPVFNGENFLTEAVVWNRIASEGLKYRWFKENIIITEYLENGLSDNYDKLMLKNFNGAKLYYKELINNKNISAFFRYVHISYIYLKFCDEKKCRDEGLRELTKNPFLRLFIKSIYNLKNIKYGR